MNQLQDIRYILVILKDNTSGVLQQYIVGSFAIHSKIEVYTSVNLTIDKHIIYGGFLKHKLNTLN